MNVLQKAKEFAAKYHADQKRSNGKDYVDHSHAVAEILKSCNHDETIQAIAELHDVLENTSCTYQILEQEFGKEIADYVLKLSKRSDETYFDYISRIALSGDRILIYIKLADLQHNMKDGLKEGTLKDKYRFARKMLSDSLCRKFIKDF